MQKQCYQFSVHHRLDFQDVFGVVAIFVIIGVGLTGCANLNRFAAKPSPTPRPIRRLVPTFTPTLPATWTPTATWTPSPTATPTLTPVPPTLTPTPVPPTATSSPTPPPPTPTPLPTAAPTPSFAFVIAETGQFPTTHLNFDVYIAITDANNIPLSGYRVIGYQSSGLQLESQVSAGAWTENSGAKHYKAGNIKYEALNSPGGVWKLQLVDGSGQPVAPAIEFPFDPASPTWYFLLYRKSE